MLKDLTQAEVRALFTYDKKEGLLRWRNPSGRFERIPAGSVAGSTTNKEGYRYVTINGKLYRGSRIIWLWVTGEWPPVQVDHEDRDTGNDKWTNLRLANGSQNKANSGKYGGKPKSSLLKGVQAVQKARGIRYRAIATKDGLREHLGYFDTEELAHAAYLKRSEELHGEFARSS